MESQKVKRRLNTGTTIKVSGPGTAAVLAALVGRESNENDQARLVEDATRYRRLRILGCTPYDGDGLLRFQNLDNFVDADLRAHKSRGEAT